MTKEAGGLVIDLPDDWFEKEERSLRDLRFRLERKQRELAVQEADLEAQARDLHEREERVRDSLRATQETSQDLMARSHRLREQQRELAAAQEVVQRDSEALAKARQDVDARASDLSHRESELGESERRLREREEALSRTERESERTRRERARAGAEAPGARVRGLAADAAPTDAGRGAVPDSADVLRRLLELKDELQATIARVRSREGEAQSLLSQAGERAMQVRNVEETLREQERRLEGVRSEIVNAKRALLTVDHALSRMPYEVVDDFTKSAEFDAYERALRVLKRFEESPGHGS